MNNQKYNPGDKDLTKSKMCRRVGYKKGTFVTELDKLVDIISNGGQVEIRAQDVRSMGDSYVDVIECRIYFVAGNQEAKSQEAKS